MATVSSMPMKWYDRLMLNSGKPTRPYAHIANCRIALKYAPEWKGVLVWNTYKQQIETGAETPWGKRAGLPWEDHDNSMTAEWLQIHDIHANTALATETAATIARDNDYDPLLNWLTGLQWDGIPRIDEWLHYFFGADDVPFTRLVARKWLISAVARAIEPGCKADHVLILEGAQGIRKSSALEVLAGGPEFFNGTGLGSDLESKDAKMLCSGNWIVEFAELQSIMSHNARSESVKMFLTATHDTYRPPYGVHNVSVPRRCIFAATTNNDNYMKDITGNRRFWPVKCGDFVRIKQLQAEREQLWAEAFMAYDSGEQWWLGQDDEQVARQHQAERMEIDPWHDDIGDWLAANRKTDVSVSEVFEFCLRRDIGAKTRADEMRIAACLFGHGWKKYRVPGKGNRRWISKPRHDA